MHILICMLFVTCAYSAEQAHIWWFEPDSVAFEVVLRLDREDRSTDFLTDPALLAAVNGGFFDTAHQPVGRCRIASRDIVTTIDPSLSGLIAIENGRLRIVPTGSQVSEADHILQAGPFIIDPGGRAGIHSDNGRRFARCALGVGHDSRIALIFHPDATLFELCTELHATGLFERVLNLDGGPSAFIDCEGFTHPFRHTPATFVLIRRSRQR